MTEDHDHVVQDWFKRSVEELPAQTFTLRVLKQVQRHERHLRLQRYAALLVAIAAVCLLLPELIHSFNTLAALPLAIVAAAGEQGPLLVVALTGFVWWQLRALRKAGLFSRS